MHSNAMTPQLLTELAAYIPRDRVEALLRDAPLARDGIALIADISGFTPLTEALTAGLSADQGAEELTRALDSVFTPLITEVHAFGGSVIKFGGDALIVWYPRAPGARRAALLRAALTSAWRMQRVMQRHGRVPTPIGPVVLRMKIGMAYGAVRRFAVGLIDHGLEDALVGRTLDRMAEAEHHAEPGEIVLDQGTLALAPAVVELAGIRDGYAIVGQVNQRARRRPWPPLPRDADPARLTPYVPAQVAHALAARHGHVAELKPVVSMFVQFHGLDYDSDDDVGAKLQAYFATAQQIAAGYGGRLNRLITGDKGSLLHIIFGAPQAVEEQESRAARCALDLLHAGAALPYLTFQRIGITAGKVFAGPVGAADRHDYTTMGDAINLSARLMQAAARNQILLDGAARTRLDDQLEIADLGTIRVKGKAEPIAIVEVQGLRAARRRADTPAAPMIAGRERELTLLRQRLAAGGAHILIGEAGIGKTHLLLALRAASERLWFGAAAQAYGAPRSGALIADALRDLLDLAPEDAGADGARRLAELCDQVFGAPARAATFPYLARFLGLPLDPTDERRIQGLAGESLRWRLFEVLRDLFYGLARRQPLILALDDLQWADPTSLEFLTTLTPIAAGSELTLALALRPERDTRAWDVCRAILAAQPAASELILSGLDADAATMLVRRSAPDLPPTLVGQIVERGGGNPLFLVELTRTVQIRAPAADLAALDLPDSVQGLLLAQIDRLSVEARRALQNAAVIGRTFGRRVLATLTGDDPRLDERLAELEHGAFIIPLERATEPGYAFRHALVQESAYSTLLYERRRPLHRQVAQTLEQLFPQQLIDQAAILGFHYERADDQQSAAAQFLRAGDSARLLAADEEAETLYRRALRLLAQSDGADMARRGRALLRLGQVRANQLDFSGAQECYEQAFALLEAGGANAVRRRAAAKQRRAIRLGVSPYGPATLDPGLIETVGDEEIVPDLFEGLVELDGELNLLPGLARRWRIDDAGRRYHFELRPGLRWSDGAPLTAHDLVFAWRRNLNPATGAAMAELLDIVAGATEWRSGATTDPDELGISALDDLHFEVELRAPQAHFLYLLADPITFPQPRHTIARYGTDAFRPERLVGNGPFRIAAWRAGAEIILERNPYYHGVAGAGVDRAVLRFVEPSYAEYAAGRIDCCRIEDRGDTLARYPQDSFVRQFLSTYFIIFNCRRPPFDNPRIRRALAHAIDRRALVDTCWAGVQKPADGGVVPPGMPGHSPDIGIQFAPGIAQQLFEPARFGGQMPTLAALPGFGDVPRFLAAAWRETLDFSVNLAEDRDYDEIHAGLRDGAIQLALLGCDAEAPDPYTMLHGFAAGGLFSYGWRNDTFETLLQRAAALHHPRERAAPCHQADHALIEEVAIIPLYYHQAFGLLRPGLRLVGGNVLRGGQLRLKQIISSAQGSATQLPVF